MDPARSRVDGAPPSQAGRTVGVVLVTVGGASVLLGGLTVLEPHEGGVGAAAIVFGLIFLLGGVLGVLAGAALIATSAQRSLTAQIDAELASGGGAPSSSRPDRPPRRVTPTPLSAGARRRSAGRRRGGAT